MEKKRQTNIRLTEKERRALRMLAAALGLSATEWTSEKIAEKWDEQFPGMDYPNDDGKIRPKKGSTK